MTYEIEYIHPEEKHIGKRVLYRFHVWSTSIDEGTILELSPSRKHVKVQYPNGKSSWYETEDIYIWEVLPESATPSDPSTEPMSARRNRDD